MNNPSTRRYLPVSAIVGHEAVILALQLLAIEPRIGGLLLDGEKGTAKSTVIRSAAALFMDGPVYTIPLNITEDRLVGGVDLEPTMATGRVHSTQGLMAQADGGLIYVDEINLLADHLVDLLITTAGQGVVHVHRDRISRIDPAAFVLVGSMNPEEGALRPQLLDRFGLSVSVHQLRDIAQRVNVMKTQQAFDRDPDAVIAAHIADDLALREQVNRGRHFLAQTRISTTVTAFITQLCMNARVAGHRGDVVMAMAARAHAARDGRWRVTEDDVMAIAELVLAHRRRDMTDQGQPHTNSPFDGSPPESRQTRHDPQMSDHGSTTDRRDQPGTTPDDAPGGQEPDEESDGQAEDDTEESSSPPTPSAPSQNDEDSDPIRYEGSDIDVEPLDGQDQGGTDSPSPIGAPFAVKPITLNRDRTHRQQAGRRFHSRTRSVQGRKIYSERTDQIADLSLIDTLLAAIPYQYDRRLQRPIPGPRILIEHEDWRRVIRQRKVGACVLFVVDASGSMGAKARMVASKGAVLSLLLDAYVRRDQVGLIAFRRSDAEVVLPLTHAIERATRALELLPTGGRTPLIAGLAKAQEVIRVARQKEPTVRPLVIVITDGRANVGHEGQTGAGVREQTLAFARSLSQDESVTWVVVDSSDTRGRSPGRAKDLAEALNGAYYSFTMLNRDDLVTVTHTELAHEER
ncbi:VWA domain-containing protein [Stomatohabitans albus]|uniref:VWA domain-containing protein n=1 Tax=Stomatohabitans albus TaxID=3110766 RepID=UPI00300C3752